MLERLVEDSRNAYSLTMRKAGVMAGSARKESRKPDIEDALARIETALLGAARDMSAIAQASTDVAQRLRTFLNRRSDDSAPSATILDRRLGSTADFFRERDQLRDALEEIAASLVPRLDEIQTSEDFVRDRLKIGQVSASTIDPADADYFWQYQVDLDRLKLLRQAGEVLESLQRNARPFISFLDSLKSVQYVQSLRIHAPQEGMLLSLTLACADIRTGIRTLDPIEFFIDYQSDLRIRPSVGLLVSTITHTSFKIEPAAGASNGSGQIIKNQLSPQVIPFLFADVRLRGVRIGRDRFTLYAAPGIGFNFSGHSPRAEFAVGPSVGIGGWRVFAGVHIGREDNLAGGLTVGSQIPLNASLPIDHTWSYGFAAGVTYAVPLPGRR
jgi:hypothetical protein